MPKPGFGELRKLAKARRERDLAEHERRESLLLGDLGNEFLRARLLEASKRGDVHALVELRNELKALYRSELLAARKEGSAAVKSAQLFTLEKNRYAIRSIDSIIKVLKRLQ